MKREVQKGVKRLSEAIGGDRGTKSAGKDRDYQAEPLERASNSSCSGQKKDPYVARATERAKIKIRDRMFQVNGGHIH